MSLHEVITLPESHPEYPALWVSDCQRFRVIRCKDDIQFIVQGWQSPKWRNMSYHCNWTSIATRWLEEEQEGNPFLSIPARPPLTVVSAAASDEEKLVRSLVGSS
jgi:hypothetical protein